MGCGLAPLVAHALATTGTAAAPAGSNAAQAVGNPLWGISLNSLTATRERPIFSPSRRPPAPTPPAPVVMASPPPPPAAPEEIPLKLVGTIVGGANSIAICFNPSTRDVIRLKVGESFQGWFLRGVHGREAAFEKATLHATLALPSPEDQEASAMPMVASQPPLPIPASAAAPVSGTWRDGDGQLISPPPGASSHPQSQPAATWRDGDGQLIAPPPKAR
jgi:hypothetical protein